MKRRTSSQAKIPPTGFRSGQLVVIGIDEHGPRAGGARVLCRCDCGRMTSVRARHVRARRTQSCGCKTNQRPASNVERHSGSLTPEYRTWCAMIQRCENPRRNTYHRYGGRGISVCTRWRESFTAFLSDMGPRPSPGYSIDRINNDGDYEPGNCRWATSLQQSTNRPTTRLVTHDGVTRTLREWSDITGVSLWAIKQRLGAGEPVRRALRNTSKPLRGFPVSHSTWRKTVSLRWLTFPCNRWADILGVSYWTIRYRADRSFPPERIIGVAGTQTVAAAEDFSRLVLIPAMREWHCQRCQAAARGAA